MLKFAGGHGLGVDVGNLLELEGTFHGGGMVQASSDEIDVGPFGQLLGQTNGFVRAFQNPGRLARKAPQLGHQVTFLGRAEPTTPPSHLQRQEGFSDQHGDIGLGGGDRYFRTGPGVDHIVCLPGQA